MSSKSRHNRVRYAVVGAGWFGQAAVLPAFQNAKENSELVAIVSNDAQKRALLATDYAVPAYSVEQYPALLSSGDLDAVYLVSPNAIHKEQAILAAQSGIHVLCEKPLADTAVAAEEMVAACDRAGVFLMTAYRLHFEKANLHAIELIRRGTIGEPRIFASTFTQQVDPDNSRLNAALGGHPLLDVGIYCVNAARYLFQSEPTEVTAFLAAGSDPKFKDVPEMVSAIMRFPGDRLASFVCGFGESKTSVYQVVGTKGDIRLDGAYSHRGERSAMVSVGENTEQMTFPDSDQIAPEIIYFSECIQNELRPEPDGREGLIDMWILEAIKASAAKGIAVPLQPVPEKPRPNKRQQLTKPKIEEPDLINAAPPHA